MTFINCPQSVLGTFLQDPPSVDMTEPMISKVFRAVLGDISKKISESSDKCNLLNLTHIQAFSFHKTMDISFPY